MTFLASVPHTNYKSTLHIVRTQQIQNLLKEIKNDFMNKSSQGVVVLLLAQWYLLYVLRQVGLVKAMVFPVVMYGCESWTIKKTAPKN